MFGDDRWFVPCSDTPHQHKRYAAFGPWMTRVRAGCLQLAVEATKQLRPIRDPVQVMQETTQIREAFLVALDAERIRLGECPRCREYFETVERLMKGVYQHLNQACFILSVLEGETREKVVAKIVYQLGSEISYGHPDAALITAKALFEAE